MKKKLITAAAVLLLAGFASPAYADESGLHPDVEFALDAVPGGTVVDPFTVEWPDKGMTLSVPRPFARAVGTCATGQYCAYSAPGGNGTRLSFGTCTTVSTSALSVVASVANARSSGNVHARTSAGRVLATAAAGTRVNVTGAVTSLQCIA